MRHQKARKKLGHNSSHGKAILRNMATSLFKYEQLETTDARAKQLKPVVEKMITLAKRGDLHARRQALAFLEEKEIAHRLFEEIKDRYSDRQGGYVRIIKKGNRKGDGAPISVIQLIPTGSEKKKGKKKQKVKAAKPTSEVKGIKKAADKKEVKIDSTEDKATVEKNIVTNEKDGKNGEKT